MIRLQCKNYLNFSWLNKINFNKEGQYKKGITSFEKYTNLLIRKQSPQLRLYKLVQKNLTNDFFYNKIVQIKNKDEKNKTYDNHKREMSSYSNNISNTCNEVSHESIKVQYNVNISEIGKENKDNLNIKIPKPCIKPEIKSKNIFSEIQAYNHFENISNKKFNISIDLDKKFIFGNNYEYNNSNNKKNKKYNSQSLKKRKQNRVKKALKEEKSEEKRRVCCRNIYLNFLNYLN